MSGPTNGGQARAYQALRESEELHRVTLSSISDAVFLTGDFNSYTQEDPLQVLYEDGYVDLQSELNNGEATYNFDGLAGSLDHVLANPAAAAMATGADVWQINAEEAIAFEYSRYNYNATIFYTPAGIGTIAYTASDLRASGGSALDILQAAHMIVGWHLGGGYTNEPGSVPEGYGLRYDTVLRWESPLPVEPSQMASQPCATAYSATLRAMSCRVIEVATG